MSDDDFDLQRLAEYLHLDVARVQRMAERGQLPGRRLGGDWQFARGEIHQWLEQRIGVSDTAELERMEGVLEREVASTEERLLPLSELLLPEAILVPLAARTRASVVSRMIDHATATGWLWDPNKMADAVRRREELFPTALDNGVALMHPRRPLPGILAQPFIALGINECGVPFGNARGILTDIFFLICSRSDRGHLHTLARLSRVLNDGELVDQLRSAGTSYDAHALIVAAEASL